MDEDPLMLALAGGGEVTPIVTGDDVTVQPPEVILTA
jgi:hypothetical protein